MLGLQYVAHVAECEEEPVIAALAERHSRQQDVPVVVMAHKVYHAFRLGVYIQPFFVHIFQYSNLFLRAAVHPFHPAVRRTGHYARFHLAQHQFVELLAARFEVHLFAAFLHQFVHGAFRLVDAAVGECLRRHLFARFVLVEDVFVQCAQGGEHDVPGKHGTGDEHQRAHRQSHPQPVFQTPHAPSRTEEQHEAEQRIAYQQILFHKPIFSIFR